jgi:molybdate transport system substrate-binding protein
MSDRLSASAIDTRRMPSHRAAAGGARWRRAALSLLLLFGAACAHAGAVTVAVAANFSAAMQRLTPLFERDSGHRLTVSLGSTGQLYAQIVNGAPFDVFLAADADHSPLLIKDGFGVAGSNFVYARGALALWSSDAGYVDDAGAVLRSGTFKKIALANPKTAPYGQAAVAAVRALGLYPSLQPRFVLGESIGQTYQFIASGNVRLGFVALAQVYALPAERRGSFWIVPARLYPPIDQQALLLRRAQHNDAARAFLAFLQSPQAVAIMRELGYAAGQ